MKYEISLYDMTGVGLILLKKSDAIYLNQTCGTACIQSREEGVYVPIEYEAPVDSYHNGVPIFSYKRTMEYALSRAFLGVELLEDVGVEKINLILSHFLSFDITVDERRVTDSFESWIYVDIHDLYENFTKGVNNFKGVLTWSNSD